MTMSPHSDAQPPAARMVAAPNWVTVRFPLIPLSTRIDRRVPKIVLLLLVVLAVLFCTNSAFGAYKIDLADAWRAALGMETTNPDDAVVVRQIRMPRTAVAVLVGASLALAGTIIQGITRNDLADPGLLGISGGAAVAVLGYIAFTSDPNPTLIPWLAFAGALGASALVYSLAWKGGSNTIRVVLIGVGVAALASALVSFFVTRLGSGRAQQALAWTAGDIYRSDWSDVRTLALWLVIVVPAVLLSARHLNTLGLGDELTIGLGMSLEKQRAWLILLSSALAALPITVAGTIGFVGFVSPHIARRLVGPSHEGLLIVAPLVGSVLLVASDLASRAIFSPTAVPVGVTTAFLSAPYFIYLLLRQGR